MADTLDPRQVDPDAWKRWLAEGARISRRTVWTLLPLSLVVGLALGWLSRQGWGLLAIPVFAITGLWQGLLLHTAEQSADGRRVDAGTALAGALSMPRAQALEQMRARALTTVVVGLVVVLLSAGLIYAWYRQQGTEIPPVPDRHGWALAWWAAECWVTVFIWSWVAQRGGSMSMSNALVRQHGLSWTHAHLLSQLARALNPIATARLTLVFLALFMSLILFPPLVFALEVYWAGVMTAAYRDIFQAKQAQAPLEAPAPAAQAVLG